MRSSIVGALSEITQATDRIAQGDVKSEAPHLRRHDEIGHLARAVQNFCDAVARIAVGLRYGAVPQRPSDLRASIAPATFS